MGTRYLLVLSEQDPVARGLSEQWPRGESTGDFVDGAPLRTLSGSALTLRRPLLHIHDERFDRQLPSGGPSASLTLVFPSVHRGESGRPCLTVHPIGNPSSSAAFGGEPGHLVPTDPQLMTTTLRFLDLAARAVGIPATFEATHHGPALDHPAFFVEIATARDTSPAPALVTLLAKTLVDIPIPEDDHVALAVGGGHYAPYFTDLARRRCWSFGHILSRHNLGGLAETVPLQAWTKTPKAEGIVYARAQDSTFPALAGLGARLSEKAAPRRLPNPAHDAGSVSGT